MSDAAISDAAVLIDPEVPDPNAQSWAIATQAAPGGQHPLNTPAAVDSLVRDYAAAALDLRADYLDGKVEGEPARERLRASAAELASVLYGKRDEYRALPWNSPAQLGEYLVGRYGFACPPGDAAELVLLVLAGYLYRVVERSAGGELMDYLTRAKIDAAIDETTSAFLGIDDPEPHPEVTIPLPGR